MRTLRVRGGSNQNLTLRFRPATASGLPSADTERKRSLHFGFARGGILFEKGKGVFIRCSASKFSAVGGASLQLAGKNFPPQTPPIFARSLKSFRRNMNFDV